MVGQEVGGLAFPLVTPLGPHQDRRRHPPAV
jgi:hypothetical protein